LNFEIILSYIVIYFVTLKIAMTLTLSLLLLSSLIVITTFLPLLQEVYGQNNDTQPTSTTGAESTSTSSPLDCKSIASQIGLNAFPIQNPFPEICDISIMRDLPQITDQNGTVLNKFLVTNTLIEIMGHSPTSSVTGSNIDNASTTSNTSSSTSNTQKVMAMVEFALLQTELKPVLEILSKTNWTVVAIHNHLLLETPDTIFVHTEAKGPLESIILPIKEVEALQQQSATQAGGQGQEGGAQQGEQPKNNNSGNPLEEIGETLGEVFSGGGGEGQR
jgi:hypothetical protein